MLHLRRLARICVPSCLLATFAAAIDAQTSPWIGTEEAKLTASDADGGDQLGASVAVSGETAVAGAYAEDHAGVEDIGAAYVYVRSGATWSQQQKLTAPVGAFHDYFGWSVAVSGDTAVVGAIGDDTAAGGDAGSAHVYVRSGTAWVHEQKLTAGDAAADDLFGHSVAIAGDTIVVGAPDNAPGGAAYVFVRSGASWSQQAKLTANDAAADDDFGVGVALSGETVIVGATSDDHAGGTDAGSAYVFVRGGASWSQQAKLTASDAADGDAFGLGLALADDTVLIGATRDDSGFGNAGSAYAFVRDGTTWSEQQELTAFDGAGSDLFGYALALVGDAALVGVPNDDTTSGENAGSARMFVRSGSTWSEQSTLVAGDAKSGDAYGTSLALSIDTAVVGAYLEDHGGASEAGSVYVVRIEPGSPVSYCTAGTSASGCQALLSASGTASASASTGFVLMASGVEGAKDGLFFFGTSGKQANAWGNGTSYQCVVPPLTRAGLAAGAGTPGLCDGALALDLNAFWCPSCPKPSKNPGLGATVQAQLWYRDPQNTSNQATSLSDALEFGVAP